MDIIATGAADMSYAIDEIFNCWVKISAGQMNLKHEPVSLESLLEDVVCALEQVYFSPTG